MLVNGLEKCSCVRVKCERFGNCEACIEHHKTHKRYPLPYCLRKAQEKKEKPVKPARERKERNR